MQPRSRGPTPSRGSTDTSARSSPPGLSSDATPATTVSSEPRTPRSSEPQGKLTVTRSARRRSSGGGDSAAATANSRFAVRGALGTPRRLGHRRGVRIDAEHEGRGIGRGQRRAPRDHRRCRDRRSVARTERPLDRVSRRPPRGCGGRPGCACREPYTRRRVRPVRRFDRAALAGRHDRHPRWRPAGADARAGGSTARATGSRSSTPILPARRPAWPTSRWSPPTTTSTLPCAWPSRATW